MDPRLKHIRPKRAKRFLEKNGFKHINTRGTHQTFVNQEKGRVVQVICNSKEIYPKNAKVMIQKSGIPLEEWVKGCRK